MSFPQEAGGELHNGFAISTQRCGDGAYFTEFSVVQVQPPVVKTGRLQDNSEFQCQNLSLDAKVLIGSTSRLSSEDESRRGGELRHLSQSFGESIALGDISCDVVRCQRRNQCLATHGHIKRCGG